MIIDMSLKDNIDKMNSEMVFNPHNTFWYDEEVSNEEIHVGEYSEPLHTVGDYIQFRECEYYIENLLLLKKKDNVFEQHIFLIQKNGLRIKNKLR